MLQGIGGVEMPSKQMVGIYDKNRGRFIALGKVKGYLKKGSYLNEEVEAINVDKDTGAIIIMVGED